MSRIIGQVAAKQHFAERLEVARSKGWTFPHTLIVGADGTGRRTIAKALAREISGAAGFVEVAAPTCYLDLNGLLTNVRRNDSVVIPNLESLDSSCVQRLIVPVLEQSRTRAQCVTLT